MTRVVRLFVTATPEDGTGDRNILRDMEFGEKGFDPFPMDDPFPMECGEKGFDSPLSDDPFPTNETCAGTRPASLRGA